MAVAAPTTTRAYFDKLPDEVVVMILRHALRSNVPMMLECCLEGERLRRFFSSADEQACDDSGVPREYYMTPRKEEKRPRWEKNGASGNPFQEEDRRFQRAKLANARQLEHLLDWAVATGTCKRWRRMGKELYFETRPVVVSRDLLVRLAKGTVSASMVAEDQKLVLERARHVVYWPVQTCSATQLMGFRKFTDEFERLRRCTFLFGYREGDGMKMVIGALWPVEDSTFPVPQALRELLARNGAPENVVIDAAVTPDSAWEYHKTALERNVYPMLRWKAEMLERNTQ